MRTARPFTAPRGLSLGTASLAGFATLLAFGLAACKSNTAPAPIVNNSAAADPGGPDPAAANMASGTSASGQPTQVMGQSQSYAPQQQGENYAQQAPAPIQQGYSAAPAPQSGYPQQGYDNGAANYDQGYAAGEAAEASTPPPPLPEYDQPPAPDPNDIWTPGYWNYGDGGYYWVPGTWVAAPYYGALWTPPYWGYNGGRYGFHHGYWGRHIGYYGGINYGFGYIGIGYYGGYWRGHDFFYNREVNHVGPGFGNVYQRPIIVNNVHYSNVTNVRVSFNGGPGGINARPQPFEVAAEREQHIGPVPAQVALRQQAATNRGNFYAQNQGRPAQVAFAHPPEAGRALPANTPGNGGQGGAPGFNRPGAPAGNPAFNHPGPIQPMNRPGAPAAAQPFNRPGEPNPRAGTPEAPGNRPAQPLNQPGAPATPIGRPAQPGNAQGNQPFNRQGPPNTHVGTLAQPGAQPFNRQTPPQPHAGAPAHPEGRSNPPAANPTYTRPGPSATRPAPTPAPAPHVEAARPAPAAAPAPHAAPAPPPHAAPAPHAGPAPAAPHEEGGGHPR